MTLPALTGLFSYLLLTSAIGSSAPRYGLISTALQAAAIAFGIHQLWSVLR